ncbi:cell division protein SepF [Turicibacter sanguinis]
MYAIDGDIKRVGTNLFLCTPRNVETEGQVTVQELQQDIEE